MTAPAAIGAGKRPVGRPREFDRSVALSAALDLFLERGYLSASITELTRVMGINRPSLYAAFGSKEDLFKQALHRHAQRHLQRLQAALAEPNVEDVASRLLRSAATDPVLAGGIGSFMGMLSSLPDDADLATVRNEVLACQIATAKAIEERFADAQLAGEISDDIHPAALAFLLEAIAHGIAERARLGTSSEDLEELLAAAGAALGLAPCKPADLMPSTTVAP